MGDFRKAFHSIIRQEHNPINNRGVYRDNFFFISIFQKYIVSIISVGSLKDDYHRYLRRYPIVFCLLLSIGFTGERISFSRVWSRPIDQYLKCWVSI